MSDTENTDGNTTENTGSDTGDTTENTGTNDSTVNTTQISNTSSGEITDVEGGVNTILRKILYHLSKPNSDIKESGPVRGADEFHEFKKTINQLIQNILIITQKFKEKFGDTIDPFLIRGYRENYLWLRNLTIELHRLIAPTTDLEGDNLKLAQSLGKNLQDIFLVLHHIHLDTEGN